MSQQAPESIAAWQDVYSTALLELDRNRLPARIEEAERAIEARYAGLDVANDAEERQRLADAMQNLSVLRREVNAA